MEAEQLAADLEGDDDEFINQSPAVIPVVVSATPIGKGILITGGSRLFFFFDVFWMIIFFFFSKRKSVKFADGVRPGEGTSPSGGEELSSPPPIPAKLPKEKRYKKLALAKKSKKKKIKVKVVKKKKVQSNQDIDEETEEDNLPPPSPPPGSPPPHVFPSRVKTHTVNNVHQYNILGGGAGGFPFRPPMGMVMRPHQPPPGYMPSPYHTGKFDSSTGDI